MTSKKRSPGYREPTHSELGSEKLLQCSGLAVGYRDPILPPIDVSISRGEFWVVIGRNGSGKTTWFNTMLGLQCSLGGAVERRHGLRVSYVPQRTRFDTLFPLLSREVVAQGMERGVGIFRPRWFEPKEVPAALERVGALSLANQPFRDLSEGQKQRVLLARLEVSGPDIGLLDEPTSAMDVVHEKTAFAYLNDFRRRQNAAIVVVTHYLGIAEQYADRAIYFDRDCNRVLVGTPAEVLTSKEFSHSFHPPPPEDRCVHG